MSRSITLTLKIWRQTGPEAPGRFETHRIGPISTDLSFLEMLDVLNEELTLAGKTPVAFDHDCREGICGMCGAVVNGEPHGPQPATTLCQLHLRHFKDRQTIVIEPFRARAFPIVRDLVVDRTSLDAILISGGYISVNTGGAPEANSIPVPAARAEQALDAAQCIGCGACVAACPNAAAMLFAAAKVSHLALLPQGEPERTSRVRTMVAAMDGAGFGNCTNVGACAAACPKQISLANIARLNREFLRAALAPEDGG